MKHFALSIIFLAACGSDPTEVIDPNQIDLTYNELSANFRAQGKLTGEEVAIRETTELRAIREYAAPAVAGTENDPEPEVDVEKAYISSRSR